MKCIGNGEFVNAEDREKKIHPFRDVDAGTRRRGDRLRDRSEIDEAIRRIQLGPDDEKNEITDLVFGLSGNSSPGRARERELATRGWSDSSKCRGSVQSESQEIITREVKSSGAQGSSPLQRHRGAAHLWAAALSNLSASNSRGDCADQGNLGAGRV